jgi:Cysteine-rich CPCC
MLLFTTSSFYQVLSSLSSEGMLNGCDILEESAMEKRWRYERVKYVLLCGGKMSALDGKSTDPERLDAHTQEMQQWFQQTIDDMGKKSVFAPPQDGLRYRCPCCHYKTLEERGGYDICPVCFWEDDGQDNEDANTHRIFSPNHVSLTVARENYHRFGACEERSIHHVRSPLPEEL